MDPSALTFDTFTADAEWAERLDRNVNETIGRLMDSVDLDPESPEADQDALEAPSGEPFCGCETCVTREIIVLTIAATLDGFREGLVEPRRT